MTAVKQTMRGLAIRIHSQNQTASVTDRAWPLPVGISFRFETRTRVHLDLDVIWFWYQIPSISNPGFGPTAIFLWWTCLFARLKVLAAGWFFFFFRWGNLRRREKKQIIHISQQNRNCEELNSSRSPFRISGRWERLSVKPWACYYLGELFFLQVKASPQVYRGMNIQTSNG